MKPYEAAAVWRSTRNIDGWFAEEAALLFAWIDEIQRANGVIGDIFEIGVHHGKSAALLATMVRRPQETFGVCDIFDEQSANASGSGFGSRGIFQENMARLVPDCSNIRIFAKPSTDLTVQDIGTGHRLFHIDGGHNPEEALSDLGLARDATLEQGVIAVDDPLRPEWPGVSEAIFRFLDSDNRFCAFLVGFNKMLLVRRSVADMYRREIEKSEDRQSYRMVYPWHLKTLPFMNFPMHIFYKPTYVQTQGVKGFAKSWYHTHRWLRTPLLRPIVSAAKAIFR